MDYVLWLALLEAVAITVQIMDCTLFYPKFAVWLEAYEDLFTPRLEPRWRFPGAESHRRFRLLSRSGGRIAPHPPPPFSFISRGRQGRSGEGRCLPVAATRRAGKRQAPLVINSVGAGRGAGATKRALFGGLRARYGAA